MFPRHIVFGSKESLDTDIIVWISEEDSRKPSHDHMKMCRQFEKMFSYPDPNVCVGHWDSNSLIWCQKGTELAETNNSIIFTRKSGDEIKWDLMPRDSSFKIMGALRSILSKLTRCVMLRPALDILIDHMDFQEDQLKKIFYGSCGSKEANQRRNALIGKPNTTSQLLDLVKGNTFRYTIIIVLKMRTVEARLSFLEALDLTKIDFSNDPRKSNREDRLKHISFQMGQTMALLLGSELYDKHQVGKMFPELMPYIMRTPNTNINNLQSFKNKFTNAIRDFDIDTSRTEFDK